MKMKKQLLALLLAAVMVLSLTGCKETLKKVAQKVTGHSEEVQEEDTTRWAEATTDPLIIQGIADASAKYATATADGCLYAVFNGIWSRNTGLAACHVQLQTLCLKLFISLFQRCLFSGQRIVIHLVIICH